MKRFLFITMACALASIPGAFAQGEMDAFKLSRNDMTGTARAMGMGSAFGALGGDITGIAINPAGLGVYKSSEMVTTLSFNNNSTKTNLNAGSISKNKFTVEFDNLAFVGALPINSDVAPLINFSFAYNKLKNFDRKYSMKGQGLGNSLTDYMAYRATVSNPNLITAPNYFRNGADWLGGLANQAQLIQWRDGEGRFVPNEALRNGGTVDNSLFVHERGEISSFDFSGGTTFADMISVGLTLSVTDINYHMFSTYHEIFPNGADYFLDNWLKTEGTGFQVSLGAIYKPIHELRIGVAYHSPTWYQMTDYYSATMDALGDYFIDTSAPGNAGNTYVDYDFRTPDRWTVSLAGVLGTSAIISLDYELTNYKSSMRFRNTERMYELEEQNGYIEQDYRNASTLRVGAEYRFTPQFTGRIGYAWMQSPLKSEFKSNEIEAMTVGTVPHFTLDGDTNYFTWGFGYRFTPNFYTDLAFVFKSQKDDLYSYSNVEYYDWNEKINYVHSTPAKLTNNLFSGLVTIGYRF